RSGGQGAKVPGGANGNLLGKTLPTQSTYTVGAALNIPSGSNHVLLALLDGGTPQIDARISGTTITITRNGTVLGTSATAFSTNQYRYWELKGTVATGTGGSAELRLDGQTILTVTGVNTSATGTSNINGVWVARVNSFSGGDIWCDDVYVCDANGTVNN